MRTRPTTALLLVAALSLTACGARLDKGVRAQAEAAALSVPAGDGPANTGPGAVTGGASQPTASDGVPLIGQVGGAAPATGSSGAPGSAVPRTTTGAAGSGSGTQTGPGRPAAAPAAPAGGNGGAVDVGVTADTITLGNISDLSGPIPGIFQGAVTGTQAYLAKINAEGGVYGRTLKLKVGDGQLDCDQNKAQHRDLIPKVFALIGSFSLYDGCGADVLKEAPGVPDVHDALAKAAEQLPNNYSIAPLVKGWRTGPLAYYKKTYGERFSHVGTIFSDAGGGAESWAGTRKAIESVGGAVGYQRGFSPSETDFTADVVGMQRQGVTMLYLTAADYTSIARITAAVRQQNLDWPIIGGGVVYDQGFAKRGGAAVEGVFNDQQFAPFFSREEADRSPAVKAFQVWTDRVAPHQRKDLFALFGWASAQLFVQALVAAGPKATRVDVLRELGKIHTFDADGLLAPSDPAGKKPPTCWLLTVVKNGAFQRVDPSKGFRCDGTFFTA